MVLAGVLTPSTRLTGEYPDWPRKDLMITAVKLQLGLRGGESESVVRNIGWHQGCLLTGPGNRRNWTVLDQMRVSPSSHSRAALKLSDLYHPSRLITRILLISLSWPVSDFTRCSCLKVIILLFVLVGFVSKDLQTPTCFEAWCYSALLAVIFHFCSNLENSGVMNENEITVSVSWRS